MNPQLVRSTGQGLGERVAPINKAQVKLSSNSPFKPSSPPDPKSLISAPGSALRTCHEFPHLYRFKVCPPASLKYHQWNVIRLHFG